MTLAEAIAKVPTSFQSTVVVLQSSVLDPIGKDPEIDKSYCVGVVRELAGHWLIKKKWDSRHRILGHRKLVKLIEPFGELLFRELELCIQCHAMDKTLPYKNAAEWFASIQRHGQKPWGNRGLTKSEVLLYHQKVCGSLRKGENPYSSIVLKSSLPRDCPLPPDGELADISCLMNISLSMAEVSTKFKKRYWKPYLTAYTAWRKAISAKNWIHLKVENGKLLNPAGQGKGAVIFAVNKPLIAEALGQRSLLSISPHLSS